MKNFLVEAHPGWYVIQASTKRIAHSHGVLEFGRGCVRAVREATDDEVDEYKRQKGLAELEVAED